jgi:hypothetical protein
MAMQKLGGPPPFGPCGTDPPMESEEVVVAEQLFFHPRALFGLPSGTLTRLLEEAGDDASTADARDWVSRELPKVTTLTETGWRELMAQHKSPIVEGGERQFNGGLRKVAEGAAVVAAVGSVIAGTAGLAIPIIAGGAAIAGAARLLRRRRQAQRPSPQPGVPPLSSQETPQMPSLELRRERYLQRWVREAEILVLTPGESRQYALSTTVGVSSAKIKEISASLGLGHDFKIAELKAEVAGKLSSQVIESSQVQKSFTVGLSNDQVDFDRHYAMWRVQDRLIIEELMCVNGAFEWWQVVAESFYTTETVRHKMDQVRRDAQ